MPRERHTPLDQLRRWRTRPDRDLSIAKPLQDIADRAREQRRAAKGTGESWEALVPAALRARCHVVLVQRGTMTVKVRDAAARFEVDRWLRAGGELELLKRAGVKKVKLVL